ncbi:MAG: transglycosylase SLT domain-containing protein, partial [Gammaproteobacteria bacterium]|nr:transglycosylase SLT domain-containing protein [Gammaproteobacteria bacterium]
LAKVNDINDKLNNRLSSKKSNAIDTTKTDIVVDTAKAKSTATDVTTQAADKQAAAKNFSDEEIAHQRQLFLQAENALKKKHDANYFLLADQLKNYPLYPYLQYQWLKKHLDREKQVKHFLEQHSSSRYANKLRHKWLNYLGKRKQWSLLLENQMTTSDVTLNCYYHRAQIQKGDKQTALIAAQKLWAVGSSQPGACDPLFTKLKQSPLFTQDLRWQRFDAALKNNKTSLASYVRDLMPTEYQTRARLWLNLHRDPEQYLPQLLKRPETEQSALMFKHAINRLASKDITKAIEIWDKNKQLITDKSTVTEKAVNKLEHRLALKLVFEREAGAFERLGQLDKQSNSSRTWRVRIALIEQNWPNVLTAIHALDNAEKIDEKWQYWLARAYMETDKIEMAQALLTELSNKRSFYGFLAADKVNSLYQLSDSPVNVSSKEITELKNRKEFRVAFELMVLDRKNNAKLQWWHALRQLDKKEIIIAAKLAQQWQWDEIAIFTIAKAKHWDDIELRFPLSYTDKILKNSVQQKLNPAILFGLVRRESAFNEKAHSPVGARGLMQIMPGTGRQIAKNMNERWRGNNSLYNPETNLKYGSYYYQKLLKQFNGHYALALAAYNAGPERVKKWLPETEAVAADIWIETIPYKETREYVTNVLAYALIYQQRTQSDALSMNDFTRDVLPLSSITKTSAAQTSHTKQPPLI